MGIDPAAVLGRLHRRVRAEHVALFAFALALRARLWYRVGPLVARDATRYVAWCGDLPASLVESHSAVYVGYWLPYCGWLTVTGGNVDGWVLVQLALSAVTVVLVYETARVLVTNTAGVVAGVLLAVQWEVYKWVIRPQSEFMLTFVVALALWRLSVYHLDATRRNRVFALASMAWVATVRPNGLVIVLAYVCWDFFPGSSDRRLDLFFPARANLALAAGLALAVAYRLSFGLYRGNTLLSPWKEGVVVTPAQVVYEYDPAATNGVLAFFGRNLEHVAAIAVLRGLYFFRPVMPNWSGSHALRTGLTLAPLTVVGLLGVALAARRDRVLLRLWGTTLAAVVLTAMAVWVAGWRNFLGPAAVVYALFAGYFLSAIVPFDRLSRPVRERLPG